MPIIQFELNEVPFRVLDSFCAQAPDSTLAKLMRQSVQMTSICEDKVELDPWISWPTLHRGVNDDQHRILHLGQMLDKVDRTRPPVWRLLAEAGLKVGVFGSVHSSHIPQNVGDYAFYVPDFFDDEVFAHPAYLEPFQRFNLGMTRRSARNVDAKVPGDLLLEFVKSAPRLGLSMDTAAAVAQQLMNERREPRLRIRRRSLQALIMGDVFLSLMRERKPDFATFYTNHVAAAMHRYWAAAYPQDYAEQAMPGEWVSDYGSEIFEAMRMLDRILAKLKRYCDATGTQLLIATSMGQAAVQHQATNRFATITDTGRFMAALGFDPAQFRKRHAMVPCGGVVVARDMVATLTTKLDQVSIDGARFVNSDNEIAPLSYGVYEDGFVSLFSYFENYSGSAEVRIGNRVMDFEEAGFGLTAHEDGVSVTAHHVKDGVLLIYDPGKPQGDPSRQAVSTTQVTPAVLRHFGVAVPAYMPQAIGPVTLGAAVAPARSRRAYAPA